MKKITVDDVYNYLLGNTAGFQALEEEDRQAEAKEVFDAMEDQYSKLCSFTDDNLL